MTTDNAPLPETPETPETEPELDVEALADFDGDSGQEPAPDPAADPDPAPEPDAPEALDPELLRAIAEDRDDSPSIPKPRFDEAIGKLKDKVADLEQRLQQQPAPAADPEPEPEPARDFDAERAELRRRYEDEGDFTDIEYAEAVDALAREQGRYEAREAAQAEFQQELARREQARVQQEWQAKVQAWQEENADFLANGWRHKIANDLFEHYGKDPSLSDEALIAKVQAEAFEAANWQAKKEPEAADPNPDKPDPHATRNMRDAMAQARASAVPEPGRAGVGSRGHRPGLPDNLVGIDDKTFEQVSKKISPEEFADF